MGLGASKLALLMTSDNTYNVTKFNKSDSEITFKALLANERLLSSNSIYIRTDTVCFNWRLGLQPLSDPAKLPINSVLFCLNRISF